MSYIRTIFEEIQGVVEVIAIWVDQLIITQKAYHKLRYPPFFWPSHMILLVLSHNIPVHAQYGWSSIPTCVLVKPC
jgi:hypothetical protein